MNFLKDICIPLLVAAIAIGAISYILNVILRLIKFDLTLVRIILFFVAWYFVGPIIYNFLLNNVIDNTNEIIEIIYTPVQAFLGLF